MKGFAKKLEKLSYDSSLGLTPKSIIDDIVTFCLHSIRESGAFYDVFPKGYIHFDESFLPNLKQYNNDMKAFATLKELSSEYLNHVYETVQKNEPFSDVFAMDYGSRKLNKQLGQFLTPPNLATAGAGILNPVLVEGEHINIGDPTGCGGGAMILALLRTLHSNQPQHMNLVNIIGNDLDPAMCRMTALQVLLPMIFNQINFGSLNIYNSNIITEYGNMKLVFYCYSSKQNTEEYFAYKEKKYENYEHFDVFEYMRS